MVGVEVECEPDGGAGVVAVGAPAVGECFDELESAAVDALREAPIPASPDPLRVVKSAVRSHTDARSIAHDVPTESDWWAIACRRRHDSLDRMEVLPDLVGADPVIVFCGLAGAESTKTRDHYYVSPGNSFWESLHLSGLSPERLRPEDDHRVVDLGLGLTDLVGHWDHEAGRGWVEIERLVASVERWRPAYVAFTAKGTAGWAARALGHRRPGLGLTDWDVAGADVFVLPGTSGANQRHDYDGRPNRLAWWRDLAMIAGPELRARAGDTPSYDGPDRA